MSFIVECDGVVMKVSNIVSEALAEARKYLEQGIAVHVFPMVGEYLWCVEQC